MNRASRRRIDREDRRRSNADRLYGEEPIADFPRRLWAYGRGVVALVRLDGSAAYLENIVAADFFELKRRLTGAGGLAAAERLIGGILSDDPAADEFSPEALANTIGRGTIRVLAREFFWRHPEIETIEGDRMAGAWWGRASAGRGPVLRHFHRSQILGRGSPRPRITPRRANETPAAYLRRVGLGAEMGAV